MVREKNSKSLQEVVSKTKKVQNDDYYYCYRHHQKPIQLAVFPQACGSFSTSLMYTNIYVNLSAYIFFIFMISLYIVRWQES